MTNKFNIGDKVLLLPAEDNKPECGIVVHYWYDEEMNCFDYYVAFFGDTFLEGKPDKIPYVLRYLESSLTKAK